MALPHAARLARYRLPWSWTAFDYRELCEELWAQCATRASRSRRSSGRDRATTVHTDRGDLTAPLIVDALGWRRVLGPARNVQPPEAPHLARARGPPARRRRRRPRRLDRPLAGPPRLRLVGARRPASSASASAPTSRATTSRSRPREIAARARRRRRPLPGQLVPAPSCARRPRTACSSSATAPATASRCRARGSAPRSTSASPAAASCARCSAGERTREAGAGRATARSRARHARAFASALRSSALIPALPPRRADRAAARSWAAQRPCGARSAGTCDQAASAAFAAALLESAVRWTPIAYDERGLVPCVIQDWRTGEVLTLAYMNAEALARTRETGELHLWSRSRDELWHKGATSGQHAGGARRCATTATPTPCSRSSSPPAPPATPASAPASTTASSSRRRRTRRCPALERTIAARAARAARGLLHRRAARRPAADRREGPGGGRGGRPRRARGVRRARGRGGRRRALPPAVLLRSRGLSLADAEEVLDGRRR